MCTHVHSLAEAADTGDPRHGLAFSRSAEPEHPLDELRTLAMLVPKAQTLVRTGANFPAYARIAGQPIEARGSACHELALDRVWR
ncbi:MAG: hypothetical protein DCC68_07030 [Planctomycetota bacterium]|nr:MAG: hypothetical protein DCC68_07030 [Planctomycetota bacterium]